MLLVHGATAVCRDAAEAIGTQVVEPSDGGVDPPLPPPPLEDVARAIARELLRTLDKGGAVGHTTSQMWRIRVDVTDALDLDLRWRLRQSSNLMSHSHAGLALRHWPPRTLLAHSPQSSAKNDDGTWPTSLSGHGLWPMMRRVAVGR
eukprot:91471-Prymnesium_polylepis.1